MVTLAAWYWSNIKEKMCIHACMPTKAMFSETEICFLFHKNTCEHIWSHVPYWKKCTLCTAIHSCTVQDNYALIKLLG
jgi:hypothetical protein